MTEKLTQEENNGVCAIVTGMEHSGTTYLNRVINSHSQIASPFECGILLGNLHNFQEILPFSTWLSNGGHHCGLPETVLDDISGLSYESAYQYIQKNKGTNATCMDDFRSSTYFVDKTPRYIYFFEEIYTKIEHLHIPIFIVLKPFDQIYKSWCVNRKVAGANFSPKIKQVIDSLHFIESSKPHNVFIIDYNDMIDFEKEVSEFIMTKIQNFKPLLPTEKLSAMQFDELRSNTYYPYDDWVEKNIGSKSSNDHHHAELKQIYDKQISECKTKFNKN
jgi:hypothetical protein